MASKLVGVATVVGLNGLTMTVGGTTTEPQKANRRDAINAVPLKDGDAETIALALTDPQQMIEFEGIITSDTRANALLAAVLPAPGSTVTLASFQDPGIDGDWTYLGDGSIDFDNSGNHARMVLTLHRYAGTDLTIVET